MSLYSFTDGLLDDSDVEINMSVKTRKFFRCAIYNFRNDNFEVSYEYIYRLVYRFVKVDNKRFKSTYYLNQFLLGEEPIKLLKSYANNVDEEYILEMFNNFKSNKTFFEILTENLLTVFTLGAYQKIKFDSIDYLTDKYKIGLMDDEQLDGFNKAVLLYLMFEYDLEKNQKLSSDFKDLLFKMMDLQSNKIDEDLNMDMEPESDFYDFLNDGID